MWRYLYPVMHQTVNLTSAMLAGAIYAIMAIAAYRRKQYAWTWLLTPALGYFTFITYLNIRLLLGVDYESAEYQFLLEIARRIAWVGMLIPALGYYKGLSRSYEQEREVIKLASSRMDDLEAFDE